MKKFTKISLILAAVLLVLGIGCISVAAALGGGVKALYNQAAEGKFNYGNWHIGDGIYYWNEKSEKSFGIHSNFDLIGEYDNQTDNFAAAEVQKIKVDTDLSDIRFETSADSETVMVTMQRGYLKYYSAELINGVLIVEYNLHSTTHANGPHITITLPEKTDLQEMDVKTSLGNIRLEKMEIHSQKFTLETALGDVILKNGKIDSDMRLYTALGNVEVDGGTYGGVEAESALGEVKLRGDFRGTVTAESKMGDVSLKLDAEQGWYSFECATDMGSLEFNDRTYRDKGSTGVERSFENEDAQYHVKLNTAMGDIEVETR